ncbi:MAG: hypothetical protein IPL32_18340 [Chloracidobacterium sp.]|nr:hypothetical protein [Chloracidobacterium sp.]
METRQISIEANIITKVLQARGVKAGLELDEARRVVHLMTPSSVIYRLRIDAQTPVDKVMALQPDFCSHVSRWRVDHIDLPDDFYTTVRVDRDSQTIEINRVDPQIVPFMDCMKDWKARPMTAFCGLAYTFGGLKSVTWRLDDDNQPHVLIAGTTGSGKTNALMGIIASLAFNNSPEVLQFYIVDMKRSKDLRPLDLLPHVAAVAREPGDAVEMLEAFHANMEERERGHASKAVRRVLILDELASLTESKHRAVVLDLLSDIARKCRESNENLIVCTQSPKQTVLGDQLKGLLALRLVGAVTSKVEANTAVNIPGSGAEMLPGKGAMIYRNTGSMKRFQAPLVEGPMAIVRRAKMIWEDVPPIVARVPVVAQVPEIAHAQAPVPTVPATTFVAPVPPAQGQVDKDAAKIRQAWQDGAKLADLIRIMVDKPGDKTVNTGGAGRTRTLAAIEALKAEKIATIATTTTATTPKASIFDQKQPKRGIFPRSSSSSSDLKAM